MADIELGTTYNTIMNKIHKKYLLYMIYILMFVIITSRQTKSKTRQIQIMTDWEGN